jgi:hypothetical protein
MALIYEKVRNFNQMFKVLTVADFKITVLCVVTPYSLVDKVYIFCTNLVPPSSMKKLPNYAVLCFTFQVCYYQIVVKAVHTLAHNYLILLLIYIDNKGFVKDAGGCFIMVNVRW